MKRVVAELFAGHDSGGHLEGALDRVRQKLLHKETLKLTLP